MLTLAAIALILLIGTGSFLVTSRIQRAQHDAVPAPVAAPVAPAGRAPENVVERLVLALKRRKAARAVLSLISVALLLGAAGMMGYPFYTNMYQDRLQSQLDRQFASSDIRDAYVKRTVEVGDSLTRIKIPRIDVDTVVVEGTTASALRAGAGHYPNTPLPGEDGNVAIAGHRTTYGKPFNRMDEIPVGEQIRLETPLATYVYRVMASPDGVSTVCPNGACWITTPNDWGVVGPTDGAMLTLTTCHPKGSAAQRLILRAELVSTGPPKAEKNAG